MVTAVVSIFYAICRSFVTGTTIIVVWMGIISYVQGFYPEYCLCPIIVGVLLWYLKEKEHKKLNWLAITVFFGMLISTAYLGIKTPEGIVVKDEILTQLKYVPMPYEPRLVEQRIDQKKTIVVIALPGVKLKNLPIMTML